MLQTGSSLGSGTASVAQDAADETVAHAEDAAQQVCSQNIIRPATICTAALDFTLAQHSSQRYPDVELCPFWLFMHAHLDKLQQQQETSMFDMFCISAHTDMNHEFEQPTTSMWYCLAVFQTRVTACDHPAILCNCRQLAHLVDGSGGGPSLHCVS